VFNIFRGPIELLMGVVFGGLVGVLCWFLPNKTEVNILYLYVMYLMCMRTEYICTCCKYTLCSRCSLLLGRFDLFSLFMSFFLLLER